MVIAGIEVFENFEREGKKRILIGLTKKVKVVDPLRSLEILLKVIGVMKETPVATPGASVTVNQNQSQEIEIVFVNAPGGKGPA
jgi:hypothetical protein